MKDDDNAHAPADASGRWVGRSLPRFEDMRLVQGQGRYSDDIVFEGQTFAVFLRSPHAHARIRSIETGRARQAPGVVAVYTNDDFMADGGANIPLLPVPAGALNVDDPAFKPTAERPIFISQLWPLARDRVRFPGEALAIVIAQTLAQARDGLELIEVDYEPLPAVTDAVLAAQAKAPRLWDENADNVAFDNSFGDNASVEAALAGAHLVVAQDFKNPRVVVAFMEPRSANARIEDGRLALYTGCQGAHRIRMGVCAALKLKPEDVRVVCPDTGGGFGARSDPYPEQICVAWAARKLGVPVKWTNDRTESHLTDYQGRDILTRMRIGFDADGAITAMKVEIVGGLGAHTLSFVQMHNSYRITPTVYRVPHAFLRIRGVLTNTTPTGPFRGAGRPEATLAMERSIDIAARKLGIDRIELRRRNLVTRAELPYATATGLSYDSGDFVGNMRAVLKAADWSGFERRRKAAAKRGMLAGIGIANYVECPVGAPHERVDLRVDANAEEIELVIGTQSTGQGHETSFAQVVADIAGVTPQQVRLVVGDTDKVAIGGGTHSDRSMRIGGALMFEAGQAIVARGRLIAAHLLGVAPASVAFEGGLFQAEGKNLRLSLFDLAKAAAAGRDLPEDLKGPLQATAAMRGRIPAYPTGAAVCELEVDPESGVAQITRYTAVDDAGQPINPLILHGQVHGGIGQGAGQALVENHCYDDAGQVITATFMDYAMPRADLLPFFDVSLVEHETKGNPLRVKGGGEGGTTPAPAAVMNALCDALAGAGVAHFEMPATPARVWAALRNARRNGTTGAAVAPPAALS
ncbi:MAG: xanthine dehydrogenase family protein molybdopterin-binding subunit [Beijerinckiaceae bacterium]|nr:xanthine dehydrogenase family protein molybdopterin-binding subunit [Beijerinckiaceae bacterium]